MTVRIKHLTIPVTSKTSDLKPYLAKELNIAEADIRSIKISKKSLDARKKSRIVFHYQVEADIIDENILLQKLGSKVEQVEAKPSFKPSSDLGFSDKRMSTRPIIIGSGPAGIFTALVLAEVGQPAIVIERGEEVENRLRTVNKLRRLGEFSEKSNYCFGEGGAGTFSDGKLTCGKNHVLIKFLFEQWVRFGAPEDILYDAHPHIGTDNLLIIAKKMRTYLESKGTEFIFNTRFTGFEKNHSTRYKIHLSDGSNLESDYLVIAIGHSARDSYQMLLSHGLAMSPKPFAIGARFEHPQDIINQIQYGSCELLPAAEYKLAARTGNRGIWTFCMCPGGYLLPTNAQAEHLAINGMSYHARSSKFANAAVVVNINREDFFKDHVLDGVKFQENIEKMAYKSGGGNYFTPAQRLEDFLKGRQSQGELRSSYKPGVHSARLDKILPPFVVDALQSALWEYNKKMRGYISKDAIVAGVETKTSSPIVMHRNKSLQSESHPGIFPAGEGAGFAGGIVSAALDGVRVGQAVIKDALIHKRYHVSH